MAKYRFVLNPLTGRFDLVNNTAGTQFNGDSIVTHKYNAAGHKLVLFDPIASDYIDMDALIVTDEDGNVVTI